MSDHVPSPIDGFVRVGSVERLSPLDFPFSGNAVDRLDQEPLLGVEVIVQQPFGTPGRTRHGVHRHIEGAVALQHEVGGVENRFARSFLGSCHVC